MIASISVPHCVLIMDRFSLHKYGQDAAPYGGLGYTAGWEDYVSYSPSNLDTSSSFS